MLYVYYVTSANGDSDIEREEMKGYYSSDDKYVEIRKACREEKKKIDEVEKQTELEKMNGMEYKYTT